jgi:AcrR family transcriptional regulator
MATPSSERPRLRLPAAERRELITRAALDEFAQVGYEAASVGRIAKAAGVARTVLYDHYPSKQALFIDLLASEQRELLRYLSAALSSSGSTEQRWRALFDAFFKFVEEHPTAWAMMFPRRPPLDEEALYEIGQLRSEFNQVLVGVLAADARRAGLEPGSIKARALFAIHRDALTAAAHWWQNHPEVSRNDMVDSAMAALWTGFGGLTPSD